MKIYKYILFVILAGIFTSCNDFLDEIPDKSNGVEVETLEDLEGLFNDYQIYELEPAYESLYGTDDYKLSTEIYDGYNNLHNIKSVQTATWDTEFLPQDEVSLWTGEWEKIFNANLVLNSIDVVAGSEEDKDELRAEAHFIRAYSYFQLANTYCLPYTDANKSELGLPLKTEANFQEDLERASLEDTWSFIKADLAEALKIKRTLQPMNGLNRIWRASTAAVNSFAARYYLALHDYENAQLYAQKSLDEYSNINDYNSAFSLTTKRYYIYPDGNREIASVYFPNTFSDFSDQTVLSWGEAYYHRLSRAISNDLYPSDELLNLYDKTNDLRYYYLMVEDYTYSLSATNPPYSHIGYIFVGGSNQYSGPSVPEMILIKAESQVRQGDFAGGISTVNILRAKRINATASADDVYLSASSQAEALTKVLEERRREIPFVHRWYDLRRYNSNNDPSDDVDVITRIFYPYGASTVNGSESTQTYTLSKDSRRYANPLPETDILASGGVIKQNGY